MGMAIDEIIAKEQELLRIFQKTVDAHMVSGDLSLEELYCDDTEIIEEELKKYQRQVDFHNQIINIIRKYQKIQEILKDDTYYEEYGNNAEKFIVSAIREAIENGNDD